MLVVVLGEKVLCFWSVWRGLGDATWVVGKSRSVLTLRQGTGVKCVVQDSHTITEDRQEER